MSVTSPLRPTAGMVGTSQLAPEKEHPPTVNMANATVIAPAATVCS
jgi:hypothetical protein